MTLSLVTPVGSNFIKDWPSQNAINCDLIDEYAGPYAIQSYTPVFTGSVANPVLGTGGVLTGKYYRIFDQIFAWGEFKFGTGFNKGSGTYEMTLPFDVHSIIAPSVGSGGGPILGSGHLWDDSSSTGRQPLTVQLRTVNKIMFSFRMDSGMAGRAVDGLDSPITWAIGDGIKWNARYQRAT